MHIWKKANFWLMKIDYNDDLILPPSNSLEENARIWAEYFHDKIEPGHGMFLDFTNVPEFREPALNCLAQEFGWKLERPDFIRKPEDENTLFEIELRNLMKGSQVARHKSRHHSSPGRKTRQ